MNIKEFFGKFVSKYILLNLMAMAILVALIVFGVKYGLDEYTRHGEEIEVPDLYSMTFLQAKELLEFYGLIHSRIYQCHPAGYQIYNHNRM